MATALSLVTRSLQRVGVVTKNEAPSADEASDGHKSLNALLGSWSTESLCISARVTEAFPLSGAATYTIGDGADFDTIPPAIIISAYISNANIDYRLEHLTDKEYMEVAYKGLSGVPDYYHYDYNYPIGTIKFWPVPQPAHTFSFLTEKPILSFSNLSTNVSLPPGWEKALVDNLALEIAPEYGVQADAALVTSARLSKGAIKRMTARQRPIRANLGRKPSWHIDTGWTR
jgi:hypothetical protein